MRINSEKKISPVKLIIIGVLVSAFLIIPNFLNGYYQQIVIQIVMYAYFASSWNIIAGFAGQFSLGHAIYVGIGAYTSTILYNQLGITPWIGAIIGAVLSAMIGILIGFPTFKLRSTYYTLTSIAILSVVKLAVQSVQNIGDVVIGGAKGLFIRPVYENSFWDFQFMNKVYYFYIIVVLLLIVLFVCSTIKKSKMGYQLAAIANNQEASEALGVNSRGLKLKAAAISAFFCAIGGTFYTQLILVCNPATLFGEPLSNEMAVISLIGGRGTLYGPAIGAIIIRSLSQVTTVLIGSNIPGLHLAIYGIMLIICIRFFPDGILPLLRKFIRWIGGITIHKVQSQKSQAELTKEE